MKIIELLAQLDRELPGEVSTFWMITIHGDGSGELFEPGEVTPLTIFNNLQHLQNMLEALLEHKPQTSYGRVPIVGDCGEKMLIK